MKVEFEIKAPKVDIQFNRFRWVSITLQVLTVVMLIACLLSMIAFGQSLSMDDNAETSAFRFVSMLVVGLLATFFIFYYFALRKIVENNYKALGKLSVVLMFVCALKVVATALYLPGYFSKAGFSEMEALYYVSELIIYSLLSVFFCMIAGTFPKEKVMPERRKHDWKEIKKEAQEDGSAETQEAYESHEEHHHHHHHHGG